MSFPSLAVNQEWWNRLLFKSYWAVFLFSIASECLYLLVTDVPAEKFIFLYIIRPTVIMGSILLLTHICMRFLPKWHDYTLITAATLLALTACFIHSSMVYLLFCLFFPVLVSIFYFQLKKLLYAIANIGIAYSSLLLFDAAFRGKASFASILTMGFILVTYCIVGFGILARGKEILTHLRSSYESNQELLVRTILMDKLAKTDALTETYNHMAYHEYKDHLVEQADNGRLTLHLAILDIDNFKKVNDTYGHKAGDTVLRKVSAIARSKTGSNDFIARYGGEEFVILFTEKSFQEAFDLTEDIRKEIASTTHEALSGLRVTVSIGLNAYVPGMGKEALFQLADAALYRAKHTGKNRTVIAAAEEALASEFA